MLDTPDGLLQGGDSGPIVVNGAPDHSLLIKAVRYKDDDLRMPPDGEKLTEAQVADLEAWVKMGTAAGDGRKSENKIRMHLHPLGLSTGKATCGTNGPDQRRVHSPITDSSWPNLNPRESNPHSGNIGPLFGGYVRLIGHRLHKVAFVANNSLARSLES